MIAPRVRAHGLTLAVDLPIDAPVAPDDAVTDLFVEWGCERSVPNGIPPGRLLADRAIRGRRWYAIVAQDDDVVVRAPGVCDVRVAASRRRLIVERDPTAPSNIAAMVATGAGLATALVMSGACVVHASAVELDGQAVMVTGPSGVGKSTVAAALCRDGARLVADDVLRIDLDQAVQVHRGTTRLRLRSGATVLADGLPADAREQTADGRTSAAFVASTADRLPLAAVLVPRRGRQPRLRRLAGAETLMALMPAGRIQSWCDDGLQRRWMSDVRRLAAAVPVFEIELPAPAAIEHGLVAALLESVMAS